MRPWLLMLPLLFVWITVFTPYGRYLDWDEAVFYGQSGGYDGVRTHAPYMAASREQGTPLIIGLLRIFARDLASTRLLWAILTLLVAGLAFALVERWAGRRTGLVGLAVFTTFWLPTIFFGAFLSPLMGACAALLTTGMYLALREADPEASVRLGVLLGLAAALMLSLRHLESLLVAMVLIGHAVLWRPRWLVQRWRGVVAAAVTFGVVFVVPWTLHTIGKYGSVMARIEQVRGQGHPFSPYNGLEIYGPAIFGRRALSVGYNPGSPPPTWTSMVLAVGIVVVVAGVGLLLTRRLLAWRRGTPLSESTRHTGLALVLSVTTFGLFFFLSQSQRERYLMYGLIFAAVLAAQVLTAAGRWVRERAPRQRHRAMVAGVTAMAVLWLGAQGVLAHRAQTARYADAARDLRVAMIIDSFAKGQRCVLLGQAAKPQFVVATGCRARGGRGTRETKPADWLRDRLLNDKYRDSAWLFALWRPEHDNVADVLADWPRIDEPARVGGWVLSYRPPRS